MTAIEKFILENLHVIGNVFFALMTITIIAWFAIAYLDKRDARRREAALILEQKAKQRVRDAKRQRAYNVRVCNSPGKAHLN